MSEPLQSDGTSLWRGILKPKLAAHWKWYENGMQGQVSNFV